jgi:Na+/proline symporter
MGGDLREIVDADQVGRLFVLLAFVLPPIGLLCGWWYGGRRRQSRQGALAGLLVGLLGPLNWLLWHVYNAITDTVGLDTVRNLVINLVVFLTVGAVTGVVVGLWMRRSRITPEDTPPTDNSQ